MDGDRVLLTKGAVESVLTVCSKAELGDGSCVPLAHAESLLRRRFESLSGQGYRVLGVARRSIGSAGDLDLTAESEMTFLGFLTFRDPPKSGVSRTLRELASLGISVHMITGDNRLAAMHTANAVGLDSAHILTGEEIHALDDAALAAEVEKTAIFAGVDPIQKERIIHAFQRAWPRRRFPG